MKKLTDGTVLYHGSWCAVDKIDLSRCRSGKDFGRGFYLTTSYEQALKFVKLSVKNAVNTGELSEYPAVGYVNSYIFDYDDSVFEFDFEDADAEWLHFVSGNRDGKLFPELIKEMSCYNIIGGKIANDHTAATLNLYMNGTFGTPGESDADDIAIRLLLPNRLQNQYCFRDETAVNCLRIIGCEEVVL